MTPVLRTKELAAHTAPSWMERYIFLQRVTGTLKQNILKFHSV